MRPWPIVGLVALLACQSDPGTSLAERVYGATLDAWHATDGLPPLADRGNHCGQLELFDMTAPPTVERYNRTCPTDSWACLRWQTMPGRVRSIYAPVAVINPKLPAGRWAAVGVHELLHAFQRCRDDGRPVSEDEGHRDPLVWRPEPNSVEARAVADLYGE